ncbi:MAG: glycosyltransferase [Candidatus Limivicinus sp.]
MSTKTNLSVQTADSVRLSIIIPAFNCREYLDEGLQSILCQLPSDCELIVVDDGSDDGTKELLAGYEGAQDNVHVLYREHGGASAARNAGLNAAAGEYVTFMDCDDCMRDGFLRDSLPLLEEGTDLYIFGIERVLLSGMRELWTVRDKVYPDVSAFADEYIRIRQLMVYSNCNKFYRRSVIEEQYLRFDEGMSFGEDRMFNFRFLSCCRGRILTSALIMFHYIQRSVGSMSSKHIPGYFSCVSRLHEAKMDCILPLSTGTTEEEKLDFIAYDVSREIERTLARFEEHPEEKEENLPAINRIVFGGSDDSDEPLDIIVVLGSRLCEYKIRRTWEIGQRHPGVLYIVSGGNPSAYDGMTEAEFMSSWLMEHGVSLSDICLENRSTFTGQNLEFSVSIIRALRAETGKALSGIGILTGGFHIPRTKLLAAQVTALAGEDLHWLAAYGPHTHPENWFNDRTGRDIILHELRKTVRLSGKDPLAQDYAER